MAAAKKSGKKSPTEAATAAALESETPQGDLDPIEGGSEPPAPAEGELPSITAANVISNAIDAIDNDGVNEDGWPEDVEGVKTLLRQLTLSNRKLVAEHDQTKVELTSALRAKDKVFQAKEALRKAQEVTEGRLKPLAGFELGPNCKLYGGDLNTRSRNVRNNGVMVVALNDDGEATQLIVVPQSRMTSAGNEFYEIVPYY